MADKQTTPAAPVGEVLARNIKRIRENQRLTYVELSNRLATTGRSIPVLGLRRIERGERRVDVDDLLALSYVLNAHPVDLLVPGDVPNDAQYPVTPEISTTAGTARSWIGGTGFLKDPESPMDFAVAIQTMPEERAREMSRRWLTPERQQDWNRRALEHDQQNTETRGD